MSLSTYTPHHALLPLLLPDRLSKLLRYLASISLALAVLNVVPSYLLDGQHMLRAALLLLLPSAPALRAYLALALTTAGTSLVLANLGLGLWGVYRQGGDLNI